VSLDSSPTTASLPAPGPVDRSLRERLRAAAGQFGTPLYVIDVAALTEAAAAVETAFPHPWVWQYSLKANDLPAVAGVLAARGWGANVVSLGEWASASAAGVATPRTTLEGIGKTDADLAAAVDQAAAGTSLRWVAVESADELQRLAELHNLRRMSLGGGSIELPVLLRLNPDVAPETSPGLAVGLASSKFGLSADDLEILAASDVWRGGLRLRGIHVHMGSHLSDVAAWAVAGRRAVDLLARVRQVHRRPDDLDVVDFGGGFPAYGASPSPQEFADALQAELRAAGLRLPPVAAIEPGRVVVGAAGWLVASVLHTRWRGDQRQVVLDAGMTELIRPALYGSRHAVTALPVGEGDAVGVGEVAVHGAVCESTDTFGVHQLPELRRGDLVVVHEAGAYGASFSSRYNGRPAAPEVLLWPDGTFQLAERTAPPYRVTKVELTRALDGAAPGPERSHA
jgi:diaminopimelate decarboxylase